MSIRVLNPAVAARIAAGEVVERPSSIVKELIENAIDASATCIKVTVPEDPVSLIIVSDDGCGIEKDDLVLAFSRHATSKIPDDDVTRIETLGFRGEALPAASAISHVRLSSRAAGSDMAWEISASPSNVTNPSPIAGDKGTSVAVRDIFSNVPARLKFLKSKRTEMASIRTIFDNAALAVPDVEFRFISNGREVVYHRAGDRRNGLAVFNRVKDVLGEAFASDAVEVSADIDGVSVRGAACVPTRFRKDRKGLTVAVNGRVVTDPVIVSAIREAYSGLIAPGLEPIAFIHVFVRSEDVDVNVNPRKSEVRFADAAAVYSAVSSSVRAALDQVGLMTSKKLAARAAELAAGPRPEASDRRRLPLGRVIGQANGSWILGELMDGFVIVDQHAAHERVLLERLKDSCGGLRSAARLPTPVVVTLRQEELAVLQDCADGLTEAGFDLEFVPGAIFVTAIPDVMAGLDVEVILTSLASSVIAIPTRAVANRLNELLSEAACHAAIKAGQVLTLDEADRLLREIEATPNAGQCNHGRPTVVFLSDADLRRLFART